MTPILNIIYKAIISVPTLPLGIKNSMANINFCMNVSAKKPHFPIRIKRRKVLHTTSTMTMTLLQVKKMSQLHKYIEMF